MKSPRSTAVTIFLFLLMAAAGLWLGQWSRRGTEKVGAPADKTPVVQPAAPEADANVALDTSPEAMLARIFSRIRNGSRAPGELDLFRRALLSADPAKSIAAITRFLATGQDALTGEAFAIGEHGELTGAPTFRVLLLDMLGRICREHGSGEAGTVARALLEKKTSADEWALALRNAAWAKPEDVTYLAAKARELIDHQPWRQQPSAGFYQAFDVLVYTRDVASIGELSEMVRGDDQPMKNTAATTLDRLAAMAPLEVMSYLNTHPAELSDKPFLRSDYYAKADFTQAAQRAAVEAYLDRTDVEARAKSKLIAALGNPGVFVSENLLTTTPAPEADIPPLQKAALLRAVEDWIKSNRYPSLAAQLQGKQEGLQP